MEDFIKQEGIDFITGQMSPDGCYVADLTEDEWDRVRSKLDRSESLEEDEDVSMVTEDTATQQYLSGRYTITLNADLDNGLYKMVIREN